MHLLISGQRAKKAMEHENNADTNCSLVSGTILKDLEVRLRELGSEVEAIPSGQQQCKNWLWYLEESWSLGKTNLTIWLL